MTQTFGCAGKMALPLGSSEPRSCSVFFSSLMHYALGWAETVRPWREDHSACGGPYHILLAHTHTYTRMHARARAHTHILTLLLGLTPVHGGRKKKGGHMEQRIQGSCV